MTRLYFVRHGESASNVSGEYTGQLNAPLSPQGVQQAERTAEFLKSVPLTAVYASDLVRAYNTGKAIAALHGLVPVPIRDLREINGGLWEGKHYDELQDLYPDSYGLWRRQIGLAAAPNGEAVSDLQNRVRRCVESIVRAHPNGAICIATHATPIRAMECVWTNTDLENMHTIPWVSNASVTVVEYDGDMHARIIERDMHEHLQDIYTKLPKSV